MTEIERIEDQLRRAFEGETWSGAALKEALRGVTAKQAAQHPIANAHSIWEIVLHVTAWKEIVRHRLEGEHIRTPANPIFPPVEIVSEDAWENTLEMLEGVHEKLQQAAARLDESQLEKAVMDGGSSVYATVHGALQHDLYHAAQISILKKAWD